MPKFKHVHAIAAAVCGIAILGGAYGLPEVVAAPAAPEASSDLDVQRPADIDTWPTIGTTMRMTPGDPAMPWQMRKIQMAPAAYESLVSTGEYADGTILTATFHSVELDTSHTPPFYRADEDRGFAVEIIDRSHPDGRRFYGFVPGQMRAAPLPAGNACATCHNERGSFDGTFAHLYPTISRFADGPNRP